MTRSAEDRYRRLLRWYPRAWRRANEAVVLGTMLDVAEHEGRSRPTARQHASVMVHGLGVRMDVRSALVAALIGLVVAAAAGALSVWGTPASSALGVSWMLPLLTVCVVPSLASFGLIALARDRGLVSPPGAVVTTVVSVVALGWAVLAQHAGTLAFDFAEQDLPATGLAAAFVPVFLIAWLTGAAAIAVVIDALLVRTGIPRGVVVLLAAVCGAIAAPIIGISLISPATSTIVVAGVAVLALACQRTEGAAEPTTGAARGSRRVPAKTLMLARLLAWIGTAGGVIGVGYALTGAMWSPGAADGTGAVAQGITISVLAGLPFLGAVVVVTGARRAHSIATWGPLVLFALALCALAVAYASAPSWDAMAPALAASAALTGAAIACWLGLRMRGPAPARVLTAILLGLGYATFLGTMLAPMLAFLLPLGAAVYAVWGTRTPRPARPAAPAAGGVATG